MSAFGEDQVRERLRMAAGDEWPAKVRKRAASPEPDDMTLASHEEGPEKHEREFDGPHAPETPHAPDAPDLPDSPELPPHRAPESPDLPDLPEVPSVPHVDGPTRMPEIPDAPGILDSPEIPPTPDIPAAPEIEDMPRIADMPEIPEPPEIPETPGIYDAPEIPDPPEIDDAPDLPDVTGPTEVPGTPRGPLSPDTPDLPRAPDLPEAPRPDPDGHDGGRDAGTAMHSNEANQPELRSLPGGSAAHADGATDRTTKGIDARSDGPGSSEPSDEPSQSDRSDRPLPTALPMQQSRGTGATPAAGGPGAPGDSGGGSIGTGGGGDGAAGDDGEDEGEEALRRMLHESVRDIQPSPESLNYLRHAIPARQAQRRRVLAGAAAAVVLAGVGVPALVTTGLMPGTSGDHSIYAGDSQDQSRGEGGQNSAGQTQGPDSAAGGSGHSGGKGSKGDGSASPSPSAGKESGGADPSDTLATSAPSCGRQQLGEGSATAGNPDADGKVYGSFRVVNTSSDACTVEGEGVVGASARGLADSDRINVLDHTPGDAAGDLPDPGTSPDALVLRPGDAYLVRFAWVPSECPSSGSPSPRAEDAEGPGGSNAGSGGNGGSNGNSGGPGTPETGGGDSDGGGDVGGGGGEDEAAVVLTHTPDVGDPAAANTTLDGACAGTLYRTGVLASG